MCWLSPITVLGEPVSYPQAISSELGAPFSSSKVPDKHCLTGQLTKVPHLSFPRKAPDRSPDALCAEHLPASANAAPQSRDKGPTVSSFVEENVQSVGSHSLRICILTRSPVRFMCTSELKRHDLRTQNLICQGERLWFIVTRTAKQPV